VTCTDCPAEFASKRKLLKHYHEAHFNPEKKGSEFPCSKCSKKFPKRVELKLHMNLYHWSKPQEVSEATKENTQKESKNKLSFSTGLLVAPSHRCSRCKISFPNYPEFRKHYYTLHLLPKKQEAQSVLCPTCGEKFITKNDLWHHQKVAHEGTKYRFKCSQCDYVSVGWSHVRKHEKIKHGEREFSCVLCKLKFVRERDLNKHFDRVHRKELPFECGICKRGFFRDTELRRHSQTKHRYNCNSCSLRFSQRPHLIEHLKEAHGTNCKEADLNNIGRLTKTYFCSICRREFPAESNYLRHKDMPHLINCEDCPMAFTRKPDLLKHWEEVHRGKGEEVC